MNQKPDADGTSQQDQSSLTDQGNNSTTDLGHRKPSVEFKNRPGTTDARKDYKHLYIANLILKLIVDDNVEDFYLSSKHEAFGVFDDVVVEIKYVEQEQTVVYAIQLKHGNDKTLEMKDLMAQEGNFSLNNYYSENTFNPKVKIILFTNCKSNLTEKTSIELRLNDNTKRKTSMINLELVKSEQSDLLKTSDQGVCYQVISDKNTEFFQNFILYTNQADVTILRKQTLDFFTEKFGGDEDIFKKFVNFIVQWNLNQENKNKLDKIWMKKQLFVFVSSPFMRQLAFSLHATVNGRKKIFRDAFTKFGMLCLGTQNYEIIKFLWQDIIIDPDVFSQINVALKKYLLSSRWVQHREDLNREDQELNQLLWLLEKCPLILEGCPQVYKAIKVCTSKNIIILDDSEDFEITVTFRNLSDLKPYKDIYEDGINTFTYSIEGQVETPLTELVKSNEDLEREITADKLAEMITGPLQIGNQSNKLPPCHVPRKLTKIVMDFELLTTLPKNTIGLVTHVEDNNWLREIPNTKTLYQISGDDNVVYISPTDISNKDFSKITSENPTKCIHHFRYLTKTKLEWINSKHSCEEEINPNKCFKELYKFSSKNEQTSNVLSESEIFGGRENSINIICANPGMGKSTLTTRLKNNSCSKEWTVVIHAINHGQHFRKSGTNVDEFMNNLLSEKLHDKIEKEVLNSFLKENRIRLIWDKLDEVTEDSLKIILSLVEEISTRGIKQWLMSRNTLKNRLETRFKTFARDLKQFNDQEQKTYISHRLKVTHSKLSEIYPKIKSNIEMFSNNDILGTPLHIFMLTELLFQDNDKYLKSLTILDLYEHFVNEKFKILFGNKPSHHFDNIEKCEKEKEKHIKFYQDIAFHVHFNKESKKIDLQFETAFEVGLIKPTANPNEFVHNSYGEYFTALYLFENNPNIVREYSFISDEKFNTIRFFLDSMLARNSKPVTAILCQNYTLFQKCSEEELNTRDLLGRDVLELSCAWNKEFSNLNPSRSYYLITATPGYYTKIKSKFNKLYLFVELSKKKMLLFFPALIPFYDRKRQDFYPKYFKRILNYLILLDNVVLFHLLQTSAVFKLYYDRLDPLDLLSRALYSPKVLEKILNDEKFGERINIPDSKDVLPIHYACQNSGGYKIVQLLLEKSTRLDVPDSDGFLPIHYACKNYEGFNIVKLLLEKGARMDVPDSSGVLPIHYACQNIKGSKIVQLLLIKGAKIDAPDLNGLLPIHYACQNSNGYETIQLLLDKSARLDVPDSSGDLPIHYACQNFTSNWYKTLELLLESGSETNTPDSNGVLLIHYACQYSGGYEMVLLLLEKGAKLDAPDLNGLLPIHYACQNSEGYETVQLLLEKGAKINVQDSNGLLPIHYACRKKDVFGYEMVYLLLEKGAAINIPDSNGALPIHYACQRSSGFKTVQLLLKKGAEIDTPDSNGVLPIHYACRNKDVSAYEIVKLLLEKGARIDVPDSNGVLPIRYACQNSYKIKHLLIVFGATIEVSDSNGVLRK